MPDKKALDKAIRAAYDSWTVAETAFAKLEQEVAKPAKTLESLKRKIESVKKLIKETQTALADLRKKVDALFKLANEFEGKEWENANIVCAVLDDQHRDMKKVVDQAAKDFK